MKLVDHGVGVGEFALEEAQLAVARLPAVVDLQLAVVETVAADLGGEGQRPILVDLRLETRPRRPHRVRQHSPVHGGARPLPQRLARRCQSLGRPATHRRRNHLDRPFPSTRNLAIEAKPMLLNALEPKPFLIQSNPTRPYRT